MLAKGKRKTDNRCSDQNDDIGFISKEKRLIKSCSVSSFTRSRVSRAAIAMATKGARGFTLLYVSVQP